MDNNYLIKSDIIIAKILFDFFNQTYGESLITYKMISDKAKEKGLKNEPDSLRYVLDHINSWCKKIDCNCPFISALVINHKEAQPGKGFYELYNKFYSNSRFSSDKEKFIDEWKRVREYLKWDNIINDLKNCAMELGMNWDDI